MREMSLRNALTIGMIIIALLGIIGLPPAPVRGQSGEAVSLAKQVEPTNPNLGDEVEVSLFLTGSNALCSPEVVTGAPLDVALVIDHSGSMENILESVLGARSKLWNAKEAAKALIDQLNPKTDRVGLIQFDTEAQLVHPLSSRFETVKRAVDSLSGGTWTALDAGLDKGREEVTGPNHNPRAAQILIILSDGRSDRAQAAAAAQDAKDEGIRPA
jgi:hypothetical protein